MDVLRRPRDLIQNTQNRDGRAIQLKLDELIRAVEGARTKLVHLEDFTDDELAALQEQFSRLHARLADREGTTDRRTDRAA